MNRITKVSSALIVLALLIGASMSQAAPTSAASVGDVDFDAQFYSDKVNPDGAPSDDFNIVTIMVEDVDLTPARTAVARFAPLNAQDFLFKMSGAILDSNFAVAAVLEGEKEQVDTFDGDDGASVVGCNNCVFALTQRGRDADADGAITAADITVELDGTEITAGVLGTEYTLNTGGNATDFIASVQFNQSVATTSEVVLTYEMSEYDQVTPGNTPIRSGPGDIAVQFGSAVDSVPSAVPAGIVNNNAGTIETSGQIAIGGLGNEFVRITFLYDVLDTAPDVVTITTPTATSLNKVREVDGVETSVTSNVLQAVVALFNAGDFAVLDKEANRAGNDFDASGVVEVDEMRMAVNNSTPALADRVDRAFAALPIATGQAATAATDFMALVVPVTDGETLTATYVDAHPSAIRTTTASIDLTPPTITLVSPGHACPTSNTTPILEVRVTDADAGVASAEIGLSLDSVEQATAVKSPVEDGFRVTFIPPGELAQASYTWNVNFAGHVSEDIRDRVGNTPTADDPGTVENESALGSLTNPFIFTIDPGAQVCTDLAVTKTASADPAPFRQDLAYSIVVTNQGSESASGVVLTDTLPSGPDLVSISATQGSVSQSGLAVEWDLGLLAAGASASLELVVTPNAEGIIVNTAQVTFAGTDPDTTNNATVLETHVVFVKPPVRCMGLIATIVGTPGADMLIGTQGPDVIAGLGGNDFIRGLEGDDVICGGAGRDLIAAGPGNDTAAGGRGNDTITGGDGFDTLMGGGGNDYIFGGEGDDVIRGGPGDDVLAGSHGDDIIFGERGDDRLLGNDGDDISFGGPGDDFFECGPGPDLASGGPGFDSASFDCEVRLSIEAS